MSVSECVSECECVDRSVCVGVGLDVSLCVFGCVLVRLPVESALVRLTRVDVGV